MFDANSSEYSFKQIAFFLYLQFWARNKMNMNMSEEILGNTKILTIFVLIFHFLLTKDLVGEGLEQYDEIDEYLDDTW